MVRRAMRHTLLSLALLAGCQPDETDVSLTVLDADSDADADADADTDADADADSDADTDTDPVCDPITAFSIAPGGLLLDVSLHVEVGAAEDVFVACTSPTEPLEKHLVESSGPATSHDLPLRGCSRERSTTASPARPAAATPSRTRSRRASPSASPSSRRPPPRARR